jgi:hypothetical protein
MFAALRRPRARVVSSTLIVLGAVIPASLAQSPAVAAAPPTTQPFDVNAPRDGQPLSDSERDALAEYIHQQVEQRAREKPATQPATRPAPPVPARPTATRPGGAALSGGARLEMSPTVFDFKEVWQGEPAEGEFTIKNVGTDPLTLETRSSCGCTVATKPESPLAPGATTTFKISYHTTRAGPANKSVTVTTNDPTQPSVVIKVMGTVKSPVTMTPSDRIAFSNLERDAVVSQTIRLATNFDSPLNLKQRENQKLEPFQVELKELEPGRLYELTATTKPPLRLNMNNATVFLETGNEKVPSIPVYVSAHVPPLVSLTPPRLTVTPAATRPLPQIVRVQTRAGSAVRVTEVKSSVDAVRWEILPPEEPPAGSTTRSQVVRVTLPPYDELPNGTMTLQIFTDAPDEAYQHFTVPIVKSAAHASDRVPTAGQPPAPTTAPTPAPPPTP